MSSASRKGFAALVAAGVLTGAFLADLSAVASAKAEALVEAKQDRFFGGEQRRTQFADYDTKAEYDGRFSFVRLRYGAASDLASGRRRGEPTWAHDFPRADFHFLKILGELTFLPT